MGTVSNYWQLSLPDFNGKRKQRTIGVAQEYLQTQFSQLIEADAVDDGLIQRQILAAIRIQQPQIQQFQIAPALSLRCCISDYIYQACLGIVRKFGLGRQTTQQISIVDLLPLVLNDDGFDPKKSLARRSALSDPLDKEPQPPFSFSILKTWNPDKSNLNTWTNHHVLQNPDIAQTLAENGILLISDWALLNDTSLIRLQKILTGIMYQLTPSEVETSCHLLKAYHTVYRNDRIQERLSGTGQTRCQEPTIAQLERMETFLKTTFNLVLDREQILKQIKNIAAQIRQYRIARKGGPIRVDSLDVPEVQVNAQAQASGGDSDFAEKKASDFLAVYRQDFLECLDTAIGMAIEDEFQRLKKRANGRPDEYILGLKLTHCQGRSMTEIAPQLGLEKQYQVSRLLKLDDLRTNVRQRSLLLLRDRVRQKVAVFASPAQLERLDQLLDNLLDEQLESVMRAASAESMAPNSGHPPKNQLARRICRYLDARNCN